MGQCFCWKVKRRARDNTKLIGQAQDVSNEETPAAAENRCASDFDRARDNMSKTENLIATTAENDSVSDYEFKKGWEFWNGEAKGRPLRVLVCGLGGVGKSTLINNFLQLEEADKLKVGKTGRATTTTIDRCKRKIKSGIKVCLFDTPGLDEVSDEDIVAKMRSETKWRLDLVFYCITLAGSARVLHGDVEAINILTKAFTSEIWKRSVIVLTHANVLEGEVDVQKEDYDNVIRNIKENIQKVLKVQADIDNQTIGAIPVVTAGGIAPILKYECKNWVDQLFLEALKQVNPEMFPALYEVRLSRMNTEVGEVQQNSGAVLGEVTTGRGCGLQIVGSLPADIERVAKLKFNKWKNYRS